VVDTSAANVVQRWTAAMEAHASQMKTRNYVELQLTRSRLNGLRAGVENATLLFPADPLVVSSIATIGRGARSF
jgi:N-acetylglucosamine malate deacetylase 1